MVARRAIEPTGPLDPDPFLAGGAKPIAWAWRELRDLHNSWRQQESLFPYLVGRASSFPLLGPNEITLATIAFIPDGQLPAPFRWVFVEDGVDRQPDWLSTAFMQNRFRVAHGIRLQTYSEDEL